MDSAELAGTVLDGRYRVIEAVARGAMGVVYRAERVGLGKIVAVKVMHDELPDELSARKRFEIEAKAMAKLEHPNCAAVLDVGVHEGRAYVVMDFITGSDLKSLVDEGPLPPARAIAIMRQVLSGVAHAHELSIVHRDIKPANIMISHKAGLGDHVKILDFGLARLQAEQSGTKLTTGIVVGTPAYMAPEQIRGQDIDARCDLYSSGVVLFELLTAHKPFHSEKDDPIEVVSMHLKHAPPTLAQKLPNVYFGPLEDVVAKALQKAPKDRYQTATEMVVALDAAAKALERHADPERPLPAAESSVGQISDSMMIPQGGTRIGLGAHPAGGSLSIPVEGAKAISVDGPKVATASGWDVSTPSSNSPVAAPQVSNAPQMNSAPVAAPQVSNAPQMNSAPVAAPQVSNAPQMNSAPVAALQVSNAPQMNSAPVAAPQVSNAPQMNSAPVAAPQVSNAPQMNSAPVAAPQVSNAPQMNSAPVAAPQVSNAPQMNSAPVAVPQVDSAPVQQFNSAPVAVQQLDSAPVAVPQFNSAPIHSGVPSAPMQIPVTRATRPPVPRILGFTHMQAAMIGGGLVLLIVIIGLVARGGENTPVQAAKPVAKPEPTEIEMNAPADGAQQLLDRAAALVQDNKPDAALDMLTKSRSAFPDNAEIPLLAGRLYFTKLWWNDGLKMFREAIAIDPDLKSDPELIKTVLGGFITTPSYNADLAKFLREDIGEPAESYLAETASDHPNAQIRKRAADELKRYQPQLKR